MFFYAILTKTISWKRRPDFEAECSHLPPIAWIKTVRSFIFNPPIFHGVLFKRKDIQNEDNFPLYKLIKYFLNQD